MNFYKSGMNHGLLYTIYIPDGLLYPLGARPLGPVHIKFETILVTKMMT